MHASNFRAVKNIPGVIEVFERIQREVPANLLLIGDGPELATAHERVRAYGLADQVFFLGLQDAIDELLAQTDLLLLPSEHESFGLIALEAMATGVPVIATDQGGTRELIEPEVSGFLANPHDHETMSRWGIEILRDEGRWQQVSRAARTRAVEHFDQGAIVRRYLEYYRKILDQR
jgi:N-acetyl-alpha-D-glucosaminyl L-malate synthase BshA